MEEFRSGQSVSGEQSLRYGNGDDKVSYNEKTIRFVIFILLCVIFCCVATALVFTIVPYCYNKYQSQYMLALVGSSHINPSIELILPFAVGLLILSVVVPILYYSNGKKFNTISVVIFAVFIVITIFFSIFLLTTKEVKYKNTYLDVLSIDEHIVASILYDVSLLMAIIICVLCIVINIIKKNIAQTNYSEKPLQEIKRLFDLGIISNEEYAKMHSSIIKKYYDIE